MNVKKVIINPIIETDEIDNYTIGYIKDDRDSLIKCVDYLIKTGKVDDIALHYLQNDKELYKKCKRHMESIK
jgi:hypothetical protein